MTKLFAKGASVVVLLLLFLMTTSLTAFLIGFSPINWSVVLFAFNLTTGVAIICLLELSRALREFKDEADAHYYAENAMDEIHKDPDMSSESLFRIWGLHGKR